MKRKHWIIAAAVMVMAAVAGVWWSATGPSAEQADAGSPATDAAQQASDAAVPSPTAEQRPRSIEVQAFFMNNRLDPEITCEKVFPVARKVPATQALARAALTELLNGPTDVERRGGYATTINGGVTIQRLVIEAGVAEVDFDKRLEEFVGGSCRVTAIRAQITATIKQFPTVKEVIISIDGRTEDILQP